MRLFRHLLQIFFLGMLFFFMSKMRLFEIPYLQPILLGLIFVLVGLWGYFFWSRLKYQPNVDKHQKMKTVHKKRNLLLLGAILLFSFSVHAEDFCSWAEDYDRQTFNVKQNNGQGDSPCADERLEAVQKKMDSLSKVARSFTNRDKLTAEQQKTYRSFRQDSHWSGWVAENFSDVVTGMESPEQIACASVFVSLCSEYDIRHPKNRAKTVTEIMQEDATKFGCWPCKMAYITLTVVQKMSSDLESNMCEAGLNILKIFMLLWILYSVFLAVIFPSKGATFIKDLLTQVLCVLVASMILFSGDNLKSLYSSFLSPMVSLGLGLSQDISDNMDESFSFAGDAYGGIDYTSRSPNYCTTDTGVIWSRLLSESMSRWGNLKLNLSEEDSLITPELQGHLLCLTQKLYRQVSPMTAVGQSLIGFSFADGTNVFGMTFPTFGMWIVGLILVVLFSIFSFLVAFKIIDIFLRLGFVLLLIPLFVATFAFKTTREFTKKGFMFLMSIITEFLGLVLALNFIMISFETGIGGNRTALLDAIRAGYSKDYGKNLYNVILSDGGWYFLFMIVALFFIGTTILSTCTKTIGSFFGTDKISGLTGDITGAVAMSAIKGTYNNVWKPAAKVATQIQSNEPEGKGMAHLAGYTAGSIKAGKNPLAALGDNGEKTSSSPASKRYFGQKTGNGIKKVSQFTANTVDKIGIRAGRALSKTGIGAVVGVPLTLATKTLSTGVRATGTVASGVIKGTGATVHAIKNAPQTMKNIGQAIKHAPKAVGQAIKKVPGAIKNKVSAGFKKIGNEVKKGFEEGKK